MRIGGGGGTRSRGRGADKNDNHRHFNNMQRYIADFHGRASVATMALYNDKDTPVLSFALVDQGELEPGTFRLDKRRGARELDLCRVILPDRNMFCPVTHLGDRLRRAEDWSSLFPFTFTSLLSRSFSLSATLASLPIMLQLCPNKKSYSLYSSHFWVCARMTVKIKNNKEGAARAVILALVRISEWDGDRLNEMKSIRFHSKLLIVLYDFFLDYTTMCLFDVNIYFVSETLYGSYKGNEIHTHRSECTKVQHSPMHMHYRDTASPRSR